MNEEQKRFKVLKKESFEEIISQEEKKCTRNTLMLGFTAAAGLCAMFITNNSDPGIWRVGWGLISIGEFYASSLNLRKMMESISKKTMLEGKIEDINNELEMAEMESSKTINK